MATSKNPNIAPIPINTPVLEPANKIGLLNRIWTQYFELIFTRINAPIKLLYANIPTSPDNGTTVYVIDGKPSSGNPGPLTNGGTGAMASYINGAWRCWQ